MEKSLAFQGSRHGKACNLHRAYRSIQLSSLSNPSCQQRPQSHEVQLSPAWARVQAAALPQTSVSSAIYLMGVLKQLLVADACRLHKSSSKHAHMLSLIAAFCWCDVAVSSQHAGLLMVMKCQGRQGTRLSFPVMQDVAVSSDP